MSVQKQVLSDTRQYSKLQYTRPVPNAYLSLTQYLVSMKTLSCISLSGGQGKTSIALLLGRLLARQGRKVLMVDADPQANLTFYLGHEVKPQEPTLLEVLKQQVEPVDGIYPWGFRICF
jgi:MinD-like ATPase involved in chromosome partitioning or flagellar assembly